MLWFVITVSVISAIFALLSLFIYFKLLYALFVSKQLRRSTSLALFYVRFFIDWFVSLGNLFMLFIAFVKFSPFHNIVDSHSFFIFHITWPIVNLMAIRAFLVIIITLDRTFAVFFPVSYHNYRLKIPNLLVTVIVFSYFGVENLVFWVICKYKLNVPSGCITFDCLGNNCYLAYFLGYEMIAHGLIALLSVLLVLKIYIWNKCSSFTESKDLARANHLALIDTCIIFTFDVAPAIIMSRFEIVDFEQVGPILAFTKMGGYSLEGYLVIRALKWKVEIEIDNAKLVSIVQVKPSHGG